MTPPPAGAPAPVLEYDAATQVATIVPPSSYSAGTEQDPSSHPRATGMQSTTELLDLAREGQADALNALFCRCLPALRRWARGRLPVAARDLLNTEDLVQDTVVKVLRRLNTFDARHEGALQAYLREAIVNRIKDEARRAGRRPPALELEDRHPDPTASPLERAIGAERVDQYEAALGRLSPVHRQAVIARIELGYSYEQIAVALGKPNANAARSVVVRALYRLYQELPHAQ